MPFWIAEKPIVVIPNNPVFTVINRIHIAQTTATKLFDYNPGIVYRRVGNYDLVGDVWLGWEFPTVVLGQGIHIVPDSDAEFEILELTQLWIRGECWVVASANNTDLSIMEVVVSEGP